MQDRQALNSWTDLFRAAAAVLVAVSHVRDILMEDYHGNVLYAPFYTLTGFGHSGVVVFFVLSGFWITKSTMRQIDSASFWPSYLIDRLSRLMIVVIPALILGGVLDMIGMHLFNLPAYLGSSGAKSLSVDVSGI
jgi:peptidoglycan/LPS O-acetylase OafA/YrhL